MTQPQLVQVQDSLLDDEASIPQLASGLTAEIIRNSVLKGLIGYQSRPDTYSKHKKIPAMTADIESEFRQQVLDKGWGFGDYDKIELTYDPITGSAFIFAAGDHYTGLKNKNRLPECRSKKKSAAKTLVSKNSTQIELIPKDTIITSDSNQEILEKIKTVYYILYHVTPEGLVRMGIYEPETCSNGKISSWKNDYYVLSSFKSNQPISRKSKKPVIKENDIEIKVTRKKK